MKRFVFLGSIYFVLTCVYVYSLKLSSGNTYGTMRLELTCVCSLNGFQLFMGCFFFLMNVGHFFFWECNSLSLLYPSFTFDMRIYMRIFVISSSLSNCADSKEFSDSLSPSITLAGSLDCIQCPYRAYLCKSLLVGQCIHALEPMRECHLWVHPYFFLILLI